MAMISSMTEADHQKALIDWAHMMRHKWPELDYIFHVPNEGKRSPAYGQKLKNEGMKSGVPDIVLPVPAGDRHGLFIEMKAGKNKPTIQQLDWLEYLTRAGYKAVVCYSWIEAVDVVEAYLRQGKGGTK